jgi:hypothetical protein|tara:strand:+ start:1597 stop:2310 length:714 start_codon:yes stop_codon:yes gene_type:complete
MVDNIQILIPSRLLYPDKLILISHGSGGLGDSEKNIAQFFLDKGFRVGLLDYFSLYGLETIYWDNGDKSNITLKDLICNHSFPEEYKIIHIGFSLGGYLGLVHANKFFKNYCFYPGIIAFTNDHVNQDFSNTTVFLPSKDTWCDNYEEFSKLTAIKPTEIHLKGLYHGFMSVNKNKKFNVYKYNIPNLLMSSTLYNNILINFKYLSTKFKFNKVKIRLQSNEDSRIICLNHILKEVS